MPGQVAVYGAGTFGRSLVDALLGQGIDVVALLDRNPVGSHRGIPLVHPEEWRSPGGCATVLGLHNPGVPSGDVAHELSALGHTTVLSAVQAAAWLGQRGVALEHYWLTSGVEVYEAQRPQIDRVDSLLQDEVSRELLATLVRYRQVGDLASLPRPLPLVEQYFAPELLGRISLARIVDCGAYDGDTLRALSDRGVSPEWILALEPDPMNFDSLCRVKESTGLAALCLPVGAWSASVLLRFTGDGSSSSSITDEGAMTIQAVTLDALLPASWDPTYIKMDIEGAEIPALEGAAATIARTTPSLAISVYHRPADLWEIPLWVDRVCPGRYDFYLRQYGENCFETVLYCLPREVA